MSHLHVDLLPMGVFPSLGPRFVRRWQRTFVDSRYGVGYVVTDPAAPGDGIVGFLLGTTDHPAHVTALLANRRAIVSLALAGTAALLRRPRIAARLLRSRAWPWARRLLTRRPAAPVRAQPASPGPLAVLSALAVRPELRGSGIGAGLVARFLAQARRAGATQAELVTSTGPGGAAGFYERLGWDAGPNELTRDGDSVCTYRCSLI
jgi:GNAT superfamily N-acetyltransferase